MIGEVIRCTLDHYLFRFSFGPDLYRSVVSHEVNQGNFRLAVKLLLKFASVCEERGLHMSVARSYLGAIVVLLYIEDINEALLVFNDSSAVDTFRKSIEYSAASALLDHYRNARADEVRELTRSELAFQSLDTVVGRLALKLPVGDLVELTTGLQNESDAVIEETEDLT